MAARDMATLVLEATAKAAVLAREAQEAAAELAAAVMALATQAPAKGPPPAP